MPQPLANLLLISVGNSRTRCAVAIGGAGAQMGGSGGGGGGGGELQPSIYLRNDELGTLPDRLADLAAGVEGLRPVIASVNDPVADRLEAALLDYAGPADLRAPVLRMGRDLPIPVEHTLTPPITVGQDRLLNALGAFSRSTQACVVIDAGTAVTVDFVDGHGVFQGGAIAPGLRAMLAAMHEHTSALPRLDLNPDLLPGRNDPAEHPWGKTTPSAMTLGAVAAVRGMAHELIDRYAEFYEAYPRVVATGGDAPLLFDQDPLVEHIVPDLTLIGMLAACNIALQADVEDGDDLDR